MRTVEVIVDRSKWYRGKDSDGSALLREDGQMCCLGFYAKACGVSDEEMLGKKCLYQLSVTSRGKLTVPTVATGSVGLLEIEDVRWLYAHNDNPNIDDAKRKEYLTKHGARIGIAFKFVDGEGA